MKKMLWGLAASALVLSSCSNNEVFDEPDNGLKDPNQINFMTSTTKASINTKEELKTGFTVYASNAASLAATPAAAWYLGPQTYKFTTAWGWDTGSAQTQWPAAGETNYPLSFYAFYPQDAGDDDGFIPTASVAADKATLTAAITLGIPTVEGGVVKTNQVDYLAAKKVVSSKPLNGFLPLDFNHIMSKINAAIIPGNQTNVKVQKLAFNGFGSNFEYDYVAEDYSVGMPNSMVSMTYFDKASATTGDKIMNFAGTDVNEGTATPFYTGAHSNHLMLCPEHDGTTWVPATDKAPTAEKALIEVIYRVTDNGTPAKDLLGFTNAEDAPGYDGTNAEHAKYAGKPLFIRVGFPLPTIVGEGENAVSSWQAGKGYNYKIKLGTADASGGNYIDNEYIDENGNKTGIPITDGNGKPVEPGDPVANGTIGFIVNVTEWATDEAVEIK